MRLAALAGSAEVQAVGWALLHFLWQGTLIAAALRVTLQALPRANASARYAACCAALLGMLLAPPLTLGLLLAAAPPASGLTAVGGRGLPEPPSYFFLLLLSAWTAGCALMTARLALGVARLQRLVRQAKAPPPRWQQALAGLAARIGLPQRVQLLVSDQVDSPVVLGWLKPVILVPFAALTALPPALLEALLVHELGHVRRLDYLVNIVQSCVEAALFYHPAVHWVSRCMRLEREHCCDDIAIRVSGDALHYARALAEMETLQARIPEPALASKGGSLRLRIERILRTQAGAAARPPAGVTAGVVLAAALGLALAGAWACSTAATRESPIAWLPPGVERWTPELSDTAERYDLDPALLAIVMLVESGGDPAARSSGSAVGLMQLLPSTAATIAAERQLGDYSKERLLDPAYNLDLGAWYLSRQLRAFGTGATPSRSVELAAMAYNAGPRRLHEYLNGTAALPRETEQYRDLVVGLWNERQQAESPTYTSWQDRLHRPRP